MKMDREKDLVLVAQYVAGTATGEEVAALQSRLAEDSELRHEFLRYTHLDSALASAVPPLAQKPLDDEKVIAPPATAWRPARKWAAMAAAAVVVLGAVLATVWEKRGVELQVVASSGTHAARWPSGSAQKLGAIRISDGTMQVRLPSGVMLDLAAPVELKLHDAMHATLVAGSVTADVGEHGSGFTVDTPGTRVVDLGTRFGVGIAENGDTDVAVFQGKVKLLDGGNRTTELATLNQGDAVRVDRLAGTKNVSRVRRLARIAMLGDTLSTQRSAETSDLVTDISDNIDDSNFRGFYTIEPRAMSPGVRLYSTLGKPRWQPIPGQSFPSEMLGADVIGTFSPDRHDPDLRLKISVSRACSLFLMLDTRSPAPDWVRSGFTDTGIQLRSGPWSANPVVQDLTADQNGEIFVTYKVWKKTTPAAGIIELAGPFPTGNPRNRAMYGIAVKAL